MIPRFNRSTTIKAAVALAAGILCLGLTWFIFLILPGFVAHIFGYEWSAITRHLLALALTGLVFWAGWRRAREGGGLEDFGDTGIYNALQPGSPGAYVTGLNRVAAGSYLFSQLILAGPLGIFRSRALLASRIPASEDLEDRLRRVLAILREANKWQPLSAYPDLRGEILYLARMGMIDFSERHGEARLKACPADGI